MSLTQWCRVVLIFVIKWRITFRNCDIIDLGKSMLAVQHQAIAWVNTNSIGPQGSSFDDIQIKIKTVSF